MIKCVVEVQALYQPNPFSPCLLVPLKQFPWSSEAESPCTEPAVTTSQYLPTDGASMNLLCSPGWSLSQLPWNSFQKLLSHLLWVSGQQSPSQLAAWLVHSRAPLEAAGGTVCPDNVLLLISCELESLLKALPGPKNSLLSSPYGSIPQLFPMNTCKHFTFCCWDLSFRSDLLFTEHHVCWQLTEKQGVLPMSSKWFVQVLWLECSLYSHFSLHYVGFCSSVCFPTQTFHLPNLILSIFYT